MADIRSMPCTACPYRRDVPSGIWAHHEYEKLREYDNPTGEQPFSVFLCHATPEHLCHGWAVVHSNRGHEYELVALRISPAGPIPEPGVPLLASGNEAADWGQRDVDHPSDEALELAARLIAKYERLDSEGETCPSTPT